MYTFSLILFRGGNLKRIEIESTNIKSIFYDEGKKELYIFFKSNHLYIYDFSIRMYDLFVSSDKNQFFEEHIRNRKYKLKI